MAANHGSAVGGHRYKVALTVSNDDGVDYEGQQGELIRRRVVLEQRRRVVVADGDIGWALGARGAHRGQSHCQLFELHIVILFLCSFWEWRN